MTLREFKAVLHQYAGHAVRFEFLAGGQIEPHFHVTEVGKVTKDFVDCGATRRNHQVCNLQIYVANDVDHRLTAEKLHAILSKAAVLQLDESLPVEVEYQQQTIGSYAVSDHAVFPDRLTFELKSKQTACLAPDQCGIPALSVLTGDPCDRESGCC